MEGSEAGDAQGSPRPLAADEVDDLLRVAHAVALLAYSPYSGLRVGAALLCDDGSVHGGCNVENASFGLTLCAERVAMVRAIASGGRGFRAMAVASSQTHPVLPCGACRQFLHELAPGLRIHAQGSAGPRIEVRLSELLPRAFGPADVGPTGDRQ
jgi:cytidine deaminase